MKDKPKQTPEVVDQLQVPEHTKQVRIARSECVRCAMPLGHDDIESEDALLPVCKDFDGCVARQRSIYKATH